MFQLFDLKNDTETPARPKKEKKKMEEKARIPKKEEKIEPKKEDVKASKTRHRQNIYVKAIGMIKQVNTMLDTFEGIGLKMDFDDDRTPVGKVMSVMLQNPKDIACEALGVELREEKGYNVGISDDHLLPVTLEVYYPARRKVLRLRQNQVRNICAIVEESKNKNKKISNPNKKSLHVFF